MQVQVHYFGALQDHAGCASENRSTEAATAHELLAELRASGRVAFAQDSLRVAVNDEFCSWAQTLSEGDSVALMPPMAGG